MKPESCQRLPQPGLSVYKAGLTLTSVLITIATWVSRVTLDSLIYKYAGEILKIGELTLHRFIISLNFKSFDNIVLDKCDYLGHRYYLNYVYAIERIIPIVLETAFCVWN